MSHKPLPNWWVLGLSLLLWWPQATLGQLAVEVVNLEAGWNAVWVNLQPEPNQLDQILAAQTPALDYQSFWAFEPNRSTTNSDADSFAGRWFVHAKNAPAGVNSLGVLYGHRGYLIKMNSSGQLRLTGQPLVRSHRITGRTSNLFGALIGSSTDPLTFAEFFSHPKALGKIRTSGPPTQYQIFELTGGSLVRKSVTDPIASNRAYWINFTQDFEYAGPLDATTGANGISFGRNTAMRTLTIEVPAMPIQRTVRLKARSCVSFGSGSCSASDTEIDWLEYREPGSAVPPIWHPLSQEVVVVVPPETTRIQLELRARRDAIASNAAARGVGSDTLPLVIEVVDQQGAQIAIAADVEVEPIFGRWIGRVELSRVSTHPIVQELPLEEASAPPLTMTLLLDLPDPTSGAAGTTPVLLDEVTIQTFRDGKPVQRRFHSILFDRPVSLTADAADPLDPFGATGTFHGTLHILPGDSLNPYRHRYNPEHRLGYDITRQITITLEPLPASLTDELTGLDGTFGPTRLTGHYTEVITGVTHDSITVSGSFRLERLGGESISSPR